MIRKSERGAALLTVLFLVAILSVIAIATTEATLKALDRGAVADYRARVDWQVSGAEEAGRLAVQAIQAATEGALTAELVELQDPFVYAAGGASITAELSDATNCFNLNALGELEIDDERGPGALLYLDLLGRLGFSESEAEGLADSLGDWIDADQDPRLSGAEDYYYAALRQPYRTSGHPLAEVSELRAIQGYTQEVYEQLAPLVCARPGTDVGPFNLNTMTLEEAPLLAMLFGEQLTLQAAFDILASRPLGGWPNLETFVEIEAVSRIAPETVRLDLAGFVSSHVLFRGTAYFQDVPGDFETLYQMSDNQRVRIVRRNRGSR